MSRNIVRHSNPFKLDQWRAAIPDWGREGETWRVEPEPGGWVVTEDDAAGGVCSVQGCTGSSVVLRPARTYMAEHYLLCEVHVRKVGMWVENGRLVSWCLRP